MSVILVFWAQRPLFGVNPFLRSFRVVANLSSPLSIFHSITVGHWGCPSWESVAILSPLWGWPWEPECSSASGSFATLALWKGIPQWVERRKGAEKVTVQSSGGGGKQWASSLSTPEPRMRADRSRREWTAGMTTVGRGRNWKKAEVRLCDQGETRSSSGNKFLEIKAVTECEWLLSWRDSPQVNMLLFPQTVTTTGQNIQKMRENRTSRSLSSNGNTGSWFLMTYPSLPTGSALLCGGSICGINDLCQCSIQTLIYLYASRWTSLLGRTHLVEITNPLANVQSHSCGTCSLSKEGKCIVIT